MRENDCQVTPEPESATPPRGNNGTSVEAGATREASAAEVRNDLERRELNSLLREYSKTRDLAIRNELVLRHERLVRFLVARFSPGDIVSPDDLMQVGYMGLIAAIERFEPERGLSFSSFAMPTVLGVIKHYLRDHAWFLHAPRRLRELATRIRGLREGLEQEFGRSPTSTELAAAAGVTEERLAEAMEVDLLFYPVSLEARVMDDSDRNTQLHEALGREEPAFDAVELRESVQRALGCLDDRERRIIYERFFGEATQGEVAERMGISQMHVSRLERRALQRLRGLLT